MAADGFDHNGGGMTRSLRTRTALLAAALALSGCNDIPFFGANTPVEEARDRAPNLVAIVSAEPAVEAGEPLPDIRLGGQSWVASGEFYELPDRLVSPVGSVDGRVFYGFTWDDPPHDRLFVLRQNGRWQAYRPLLGIDRSGGSGDHAPAAETHAPAAEADEHTEH